jgi:hypothetical protein
VRRAGYPYKKNYQLSIRFIISYVILNGNSPKSLTCKGGRRRKRTTTTKEEEETGK